MPCAMFFLKDNEDDQRFTPTSIKVDKDRMVAIVEGMQKRIGEDIQDPVRAMLFQLGRPAPPYKNMNEYKKMTSGRFKVDNMIFANDDEDFEKPKKQLEELTKYSESFTQEAVAEAEFFNAETLERINPTIVEGAEDIMGAENETFKSSNHDAEHMVSSQDPLADTNVFGPVVNDNVIGQEYVGRVIGQDAEGDDGISGFFPDGDGRVIGSITADAQFDPLGSNAEGYDDRDDESIGERHRGTHKQSLKDRRDESKAMTAKGDPHHPYSDVSTMSAEYVTDEGVLLGAAQSTRELLEDRDTDIVDLVQDAPFIRDFRLSGWAASALILGTAWVFGRKSMAKKESKDAEIEVSRTVGDVGGGNDFGQDPVMIQEDNKRHFFPPKLSGMNEIDSSSPQFNPLSQSYSL